MATPMTKGFRRVHVLQGRKFLLKVEDSNLAADYQKYEDLRNEIWGFPEDAMPGTRNMVCENVLQDGSSLFLAVYAARPDGMLVEEAAQFIGFSYGFVGVKDKGLAFRSTDNLWFYSQYTAVREEFRAFGLGTLIKEFQRDVLLEWLGVGTVVCTYDPLTGVNAHRNIRHFGMNVLEYRPAIYGEFGGRLNRRDVPSDRFFMSWDLKKRHAQPDFKGRDLRAEAPSALRVEMIEVRGRSGRVAIEAVRETVDTAASRTVLVPVPEDFYFMLRETDAEDEEVRRIPLDWRLRTREAFQSLLAGGYKIIDFMRVKDGLPKSYYVLQKQPDDLSIS
jgi:predicted GNAT superfamily acetyltransferase